MNGKRERILDLPGNIANQRLDEAENKIAQLTAANRQLSDALDKAKEALERYAGHDHACDAVNDGNRECDCGYDEALAAIAQAREAKQSPEPSK